MLDTICPKIKFEVDESYGRFIIEPLERGYGVTLGNALRRILLSSLPGAAPTHLKIEGVLHEFSTIPGVREDTTEIILNLKKMIVRMLSENPKILYLSSQGEGIVTAADFRPDPEIEILNPELYIATLDNDTSNFSMEIRVAKGKGYTPADRHEDGEGIIGEIPVDSIFTPIRSVKYVVEDTRVGQITNYDRLILEVWTNGSIKPYEAVSKASQIMQDQLNIFLGLEPPALEAAPGKGEPQQEALSLPIENLELSVRSLNCLRRGGIKVVGDIICKSKDEVMRFKNFGQRSLLEVEEKLATLGLRLKEEKEEGKED